MHALALFCVIVFSVSAARDSRGKEQRREKRPRAGADDHEQGQSPPPAERGAKERKSETKDVELSSVSALSFVSAKTPDADLRKPMYKELKTPPKLSDNSVGVAVCVTAAGLSVSGHMGIVEKFLGETDTRPSVPSKVRCCCC